MSDPDEDVCRQAVSIRRGSIVAAAGYGKTEQIARATALCKRRRLILTHTHAGIDAISKRLQELNVPRSSYRIDTIAGWCLRFALSFPKRSEITVLAPRTSSDWTEVYKAAARLFKTGAIDGIVAESYGGVFVDEYQDCTREQHEVVVLLAERLDTCIFGDPLQSIFDFGGQRPVNWQIDVYTTFPKERELQTPWRWRKAGNNALADWLIHVRRVLEQGLALDISGKPSCVHWAQLPSNERFRQRAIQRECLTALKDTKDKERLIVIGDGVSSGSRAALAKALARQHFTTLEAINCRELEAIARKLEAASRQGKVDGLVDFAARCMTGCDRADFKKAVTSRLAGGKAGLSKFGEELLAAAEELVATGSDVSALEVLERLRRREQVYVYRRERFHAMCSALQARSAGRAASLPDGVWQAQNRMSHGGRRLFKYSVGSTLLVKGLQFHRAVIADPGNLKRNDWYVALTRATHGMWIVSPRPRLVPTLNESCLQQPSPHSPANDGD